MSKLRNFETRLKPFDTRKVKPPPKVADPELGTAAHKRLRQEACDRAGWRCEAILPETRSRCTNSRANGHVMVGEHIKERKDGGDPFDPNNYQCFCVACNTRKGNEARRARAQSSFSRE